MVIACYCGYTDYATEVGDEIWCSHCGRMVNPSETLVPPRIAREIREILDRIEHWDDDGPSVTA